MPITRRLCLALAGGLLALGCQREAPEAPVDEPAADSVAAPAPITLADVAGTWNMRSAPTAGADTTTTIYQVRVAGQEWTILFPEREPIEAAATTAGDSITVDAGPYESVRRAGLQVRTHSVFRLVDDRLVGTTVAHYATTEPDSVLHLSAEGTRAP